MTGIERSMDSDRAAGTAGVGDGGVVDAGVRAAFLDRDDTLIRRASGRPVGDLGEPEDVALIPGVAGGLTQLRAAGYLLVVVTNQGGVARGVYPESAVEAVNTRLDALLAAAGVPSAERALAGDARIGSDEWTSYEERGGGRGGGRGAGRVIDAFRWCPFHPAGVVDGYAREHPWRKPGAGMILDAAASLGVDLGRSVMIGDALRDGEAAVAAGVPAACVRIVCGETRVAVGARERGWGACGSFAEAVDSILGPGGGAAAQ